MSVGNERLMTEAEARNLAELKFGNEFTVSAAMWLYSMRLWSPTADRGVKHETRFIETNRGTVKAVTYDSATGSHTSSEH